MNVIKKHYMKNNLCFRYAIPLNPSGFMLHSTGANNPYLKRYIAPDDGIIGENRYNNDWNRSELYGSPLYKMVHGFIGLDKNGMVRAYQVMPYNYRAWHCGRSGNLTHVAWEICEDNLRDPNYFKKAYDMAVEVATEFCIEYGLNENCILSHAEGYKRGIASNHGDVEHWFKKHGKTMRDFRIAVRHRLAKEKEKNMEAWEKVIYNSSIGSKEDWINAVKYISESPVEGHPVTRYMKGFVTKLASK